MARNIMMMQAILIVLILTCFEGFVYAKGITPEDNTSVDISDQTDHVEDPVQVEENGYVLTKMYVDQQIYYSESIELLGCIIKLLFALIVCVLLQAGAFVAYVVIRHMPGG